MFDAADRVEEIEDAPIQRGNWIALTSFAEGDPDREQLLSFVRDGWPTLREEDTLPEEYSKTPKNAFETKGELFGLLERQTHSIEKRWSRPVSRTPHYTMRLKVVPKKGPDQWRLVRDATFSDRNRESLNSTIMDENAWMKLRCLEAFARTLWAAKDGWLVGADLKSAFRQIQVAKKDWDYLGASVCGIRTVEVRHQG